MMDFTVEKKSFVLALNKAVSVASNKSTMPILSCVKIGADFDGQEINVFASDMVVSLIVDVKATVKKGGVICVPAKELLDRVKMLPDDEIHLSCPNTHTLVVRSKGSSRKSTMRGAVVEDFPSFSNMPTDLSTSAMDLELFQTLIHKTKFSISTDPGRPALHAAYLEWEGEIANMYTSDGHRLTVDEGILKGKHGSLKLMIPYRAVQELAKVFDEPEEIPTDVCIAQEGNFAYFQNRNTTLKVAMIDAAPMPYAQIIPKSMQSKVTISKAALTGAIKMASLSSDKADGDIKFSFTPDLLTVSGESGERGESVDEIPIKFAGKQKIGLNAKYMLDVLGVLSSADVELEFSGELDPFVIRPVNEGNFLAIVMPVKAR